MSDSAERWFVLNTKPGAEAAVDKAVRAEGFRTFYPSRCYEITHNHRREKVTRALYPLYTFAAFDVANPEWPTIMKVRGVKTILGIRSSAGIPTKINGDYVDVAPRPLPLPIGIVERMMQIAEVSGGFIPVKGDQYEGLKQGDLVRITEGAFEGFEGLVHEDQKVRVRILLDLFGRKTPIFIPREALMLKTPEAGGISPVCA